MELGETGGLAQRASEAQRATWVSVGVNLAMTVLQLIIGWLGHSQSLVAHGLHSFSDLMSDFLVIYAIWPCAHGNGSDADFGGVTGADWWRHPLAIRHAPAACRGTAGSGLVDILGRDRHGAVQRGAISLSDSRCRTSSLPVAHCQCPAYTGRCGFGPGRRGGDWGRLAWLGLSGCTRCGLDGLHDPAHGMRAGMGGDQGVDRYRT